MFPTLGDILSFFIGIKVPLPINTFGFFLACSLLFAGWIATIEFRRLYLAGLLPKILMMGKDKKLVSVEPQECVGNATTISALTGIVGARIFHILEYPADFVEDPFGMLFSRGGFTFYGGMFFATICVIWYFRRLKLPVLRCADGACIAILAAYALGRVGCQLAGDGDWGIPVDMSFKPDWLPTWLFAQTFEGNVIGAKIPLPGVYPTPMYETIMCSILSGVLWMLRKHKHQAGWLFFLFFVFCGVERFLIELIRVNSHYDLFGIPATQAEIIAVLLVSAGIAGLAKTWAPAPAKVRA